MDTKSIILLMLTYFPIVLLKCPESNNTLRRIGNTRYYIIQNTKQRGDYVTIDQARQDCVKKGLKLATVKNLLSLAVVGPPLEKMAFIERMKDTWYWLDAKYDSKSEKYHWGDNIKDELKYTMILYRTPRPIGVSSHITFNNIYRKDQDKPQCLTLALPWLGSADHDKNTTVFFGHQTSFDERDCQSQKKRHAMCEASKTDCQQTENSPFILDEEKQDYFEEGNWIFGDRKYIVNWKQKTFNESELYCKSLGLQLMNAGALEKFLIPHIKMWSREVTASQFWTGMSYHDETKQYMDSSGNIISDDNTENNFNESTFQSRSSKQSPVFCVALSLAYEFRSQMPCSNPKSPACQWSFIRYAPANCNNYHGTICQHLNYNEREVKWYQSFKTNLSGVLTDTALTTAFGYKNNTYLLRSKYKQTFGLCYCPNGYLMIRSHKDSSLAWSVKPANTTGKEIYEYDYMESYWTVDKDSYKKTINSKCTVSYTEKGTRKFKEVKCANWYFYLCEKIGRRPKEPHDILINKAVDPKWEEGPQPRFYPIERNIYDELCPCKLENSDFEWNAVTNTCLKRIECPINLFDPKDCRRAGWHILYSIGGVICKTFKQNDKCTFEKIIYATIFDSNRSEIDSKGITHEPDHQPYKRWNVPPELWSKKELDFASSLFPIQDYFMYNFWQSGNAQNLPSAKPREKDNCATLFFYIVEDGRYEVSIKFADAMYNNQTASFVYKRAFNVLLNDLYIAREFKPNDYRSYRRNVELIANFRVFKNGKMFELQGHPSKVIGRQKFKLEMCYSYCARIGYKADPNWMMNSVSIVKFASKPDDPCKCKLLDTRKEYSTVTNQCIDTFIDSYEGCPNHFFHGGFCQRKGSHVFYSLYGIVCNSKRSLERFCSIERTIYAVNFNGTALKDSRGILHDKLKQSDWKVKPAVWVEGRSNIPVENVPKNDADIYTTWASGAWQSVNKSRSVELGCAVLEFEHSGNGHYEISMKTGELYYSAARNVNRTFSVTLNDLYIVKEFTLERYRVSPNGLELNVNFRILRSGDWLQIQGHSQKFIPGFVKKLKLEFCHSNCGADQLGFNLDRSWAMYGLSIVKFKELRSLKTSEEEMYMI